MSEDRRGAHHGPDGRFRNPWPATDPPPGSGNVLKWMWDRIRHGRAPNPEPGAFPRAEPEPAEPRIPADASAARITWIGHATFLVQLPGWTLLTDPMFSDRASPVQWAGPRRLTDPGMTLDALPPVDAVLLSHDHYDHLDEGTVRGLRDRFGEKLTWYTPLRYAPWFERRDVARVVELDWWEEAEVRLPDGGTARVRALPARHWSKRGLRDARRRLWASWSVDAGGRRLYFGGDSGYAPVFEEIGRRAGPFDVALLPIGAYDPRWFMRSSHMNPEEAAQACRDLGSPIMVGMHWGTFRLTDEPPLEPAVRAPRAWAALGLPPADLHVPALGETLRF